MFPKSGYGLPPVVASAGRALTYFELAAEKDPSCAQAQVALAKAEIGFPSWLGIAGALPDGEGSSDGGQLNSRMGLLKLTHCLATQSSIPGNGSRPRRSTNEPLNWLPTIPRITSATLDF